MKTMKVQLVSGHMVEIEDIDLTYCACFSFADDGRIIGLGRNSDDRQAVCIWKETDGVYKFRAMISLCLSRGDDDLVTISAADNIHLKIDQNLVTRELHMIIAG